MNILIIGGSSDVGISLAKYFKSLGYTAIVTYNKNKPLLNDIKAIKCDIKNNSEIDKLFDEVTLEYGKIDMLINMAAVYYDGDVLTLSKEEFMDALEVNVVGTFLTSQAYIKRYHDGLILNISSTDGIDTYNKYNLIYAASKAAIINMTKSLSLTTADRVICLCPNWLDSASTRKADKDYIEKELERISQSRLITLDEFNQSVYNMCFGDLKTGSIMRLDIKGDKLCLKEIQ